MNNKRLLQKMEAENLSEAEYDYTELTYRPRAVFFWGKQVMLWASLAILIVALF